MKVLGIGFVVAFLFGGVTYVRVRESINLTHYRIHVPEAYSVAKSLATHIEDGMRSGDIDKVGVGINDILRSFPSVRYVIVLDDDEQIIAQHFNFSSEAHSDVGSVKGEVCASCHSYPNLVEIPGEILEGSPFGPGSKAGEFRSFSRGDGRVVEASVLIPGQGLGSVRVGITDMVIEQAITSVTNTLVGGLVICMVVGFVLAVGLTYILVRPVRNLLHATDRLRVGDFNARATVYSSDEIGRLAVEFNHMAEDLENYRIEVQEKEEARVQLLEKVLTAQEEERKSLSRELHDQLGQYLSKALLTCRHLRKAGAVSESSWDAHEEEIKGLIDVVRKLSWDIRPSILEDYGLDSALQLYVKETSEHAQLRIDYQYAGMPGLERLPAHIEVSLYRITQEAVTNVIRHAKATEVSVVLIVRGGVATLVVEDNGKGFEVTGADKGFRSTLGLMGMNERAAMIGGDFAVESSAGNGTTVRVKVPIGADVA